MADKTKWTILTYIAAHNNLATFGKQSLMDILKVGSTQDVVHGALYDAPVGAGRYVMGNPGAVRQQQQLGSFDSASVEGIVDTAKWLFGQYPAERYGLVLWSHGTGWEPEEIETVAKEARQATPASGTESRERAASPGSRVLFRSTLRALLQPEKAAERAVVFDDGTGHALDTLALAQVTGAVTEAIGQPLDLLGMDACLMANIEVAYEVRRHVSCLVASEELVPGHSWPYQGIFGALSANPDQAAADLAKLVVDQYVSYYTAHPPGAGDVTQVALDLSRIAQVAQALDALAAALLADMQTQADALWKAQSNAMKRETRSGDRKDTKFNFHLWDLGTLARELLASSVESPVQAAAQSLVDIQAPGAGAVIAEGHCGNWFDGMGGMSVYLARPPTRISPQYGELAFAKETQWGKLLSAYHEVYA
jgi:hypothetical protein